MSDDSTLMAHLRQKLSRKEEETNIGKNNVIRYNTSKGHESLKVKREEIQEMKEFKFQETEMEVEVSEIFGREGGTSMGRHLCIWMRR